MSNILVIGGLGFIGHNLVRVLEQNNHQVNIIDNLINYYNETDTVTRERTIRERMKLIKSEGTLADVEDRDTIFNLFEEYKPDIVVHLASFPSQKIVQHNSNLAARTMIEGLINVLDASVTNNVKRFVYISSSMVYGDFNGIVIEKTECKPKGQYGVLKLCGELLVKDYSYRTGMEHVIARPSSVYGPRDLNKERVINKFIKAAFQDKTLYVNGSDEKLDFTYVKDTAQGIYCCATSDKAKNKTFNIARGKGIKIHDAALLITELIGKGSVVIKEKDKNQPSRGELSVGEAIYNIGYHPTVNLDVGLKETIAWHNTFPWSK